MAIAALADGFVRICVDPSLNVLGERCRVLFEGQYIPNVSLTPAIVEGQPIRIANSREIDLMFTEGSILAESLKTALECCRQNNVELWALPRADASTGVAAEFTITVTGPASSDGQLDIFWGDSKYMISVEVLSGDTATDIASALVAAIPSDFFYSATAAAGVVTLVAKNKGTVGNMLVPVLNWHDRRGVLPEGVTVTFAQTVVGSVDPVAIADYSAVLGDCCYCCIGMLYGNAAWQRGMIDYIADAWDCSKPQCFGHGYTYNAGTLGQILAADTNSMEVSRMAHCKPDALEGDPIFPWLKVAAYTMKSCCDTFGHPEQSVQGPQFGILTCVQMPGSCFSCFAFDEMEQLRNSGFVTTTPVVGSGGVLTRPMINNDITNYRFDEDGRENLTYRDNTSIRLITETAKQLADELRLFNGLGLYTRNTAIRAGTRGTNPKLVLGSLRAWAKDNVGILFSEFEDLDTQLTVQTDDEIQPPCFGQPGRLHVNLQYAPPVRILDIHVNAVPKMRVNCN